MSNGINVGHSFSSTYYPSKQSKRHLKKLKRMVSDDKKCEAKTLLWIFIYNTQKKTITVR